MQKEGILPLAELEAIEVGPSQVVEFINNFGVRTAMLQFPLRKRTYIPYENRWRFEVGSKRNKR